MSDTGPPGAPPADAPTKTYDASCHCGAFKYSVTASPPLDDPSAVLVECNCSICVSNGYLLIYVPNERIVFSNGSIEQLKSYSFGTKRMGHYFCGTCGASCMIRSKDPNFFAGMTCINARMLQGVELEKLKRKSVDGKSF
ncbi:uncharacterized protein J4E92_006703 [Alternaria infectoria]|uniref:uncharacterized protein n=1 Tax=Alternaria infectoria TaxID=45303 RepID=UPI00221FE3ED|nr:uncharacterized protein J4E92_006703 [Alternaria infectoria]KAI4925966.1 hypothetical protein J4E92_006703 [Alternaria infectoria]